MKYDTIFYLFKFYYTDQIVIQVNNANDDKEH